jgi:hypothetical protein
MMGANSTQGQAFALFLVAAVCISAGLAADINYLWLALGLVLLGAAVTVFLKSKRWGYKER